LTLLGIGRIGDPSYVMERLAVAVGSGLNDRSVIRPKVSLTMIMKQQAA
jgi:hypothetical protein